jgi:hypothetical protein
VELRGQGEVKERFKRGRACRDSMDVRDLRGVERRGGEILEEWREITLDEFTLLLRTANCWALLRGRWGSWDGWERDHGVRVKLRMETILLFVVPDCGCWEFQILNEK